MIRDSRSNLAGSASLSSVGKPHRIYAPTPGSASAQISLKHVSQAVITLLALSCTWIGIRLRTVVVALRIPIQVWVFVGFVSCPWCGFGWGSVLTVLLLLPVSRAFTRPFSPKQSYSNHEGDCSPRFQDSRWYTPFSHFTVYFTGNDEEVAVRTPNGPLCPPPRYARLNYGRVHHI